MSRKQVVEYGDQVVFAPDGFETPGLMVDAGEGELDIFTVNLLFRPDQVLFARPVRDAVRNLMLRALHAVAEAHGLDFAVGVAGPGQHRHRVGVVEKQRAGLGDLADVLAEVQ